jgi:Asp-tRNA(Asn)/Glu-tRNA(Gln) amidotransferase A subunit family amidase
MSVEGMHLALSIDLGLWAVDPAIEAAVRAAAAALSAAGALIEEVEVSVTRKDEEVWVDLWSVFMATYYGHLVERFAAKMDPDVLRLIERGNTLSAVQLKRLELERTVLWRRLATVFASHDALLCPTMSTGPSPAAKANRPKDPPADGRFHAADMTGVFNLVAPCPAVSVPCGWDTDSLPIGLQVVGRRWREDIVLRVGRAVELALPDASRRPPI